MLVDDGGQGARVGCLRLGGEWVRGWHFWAPRQPRLVGEDFGGSDGDHGGGCNCGSTLVVVVIAGW